LQGKTLRIVEILSKKEEARNVWTIRFADPARALPGQFIMVWVPGTGEVPMSLSFLGSEKGFTFRTVGCTTEALASLDEGARIGIRGPYGRPFSSRGGRIIVVGGGTGIASVVTAVEYFCQRSSVDAVIGARSAGELFFEERIRRHASSLTVSTDDGSRGMRGLVTDVVTPLLSHGDTPQLMACGPEKMLLSLARMAASTGAYMQAAVERYMKCAIGICDACSIDGLLVCRDGPVTDASKLLELESFGRSRLTPDGRREAL